MSSTASTWAPCDQPPKDHTTNATKTTEAPIATRAVLGIAAPFLHRPVAELSGTPKASARIADAQRRTKANHGNGAL